MGVRIVKLLFFFLFALFAFSHRLWCIFFVYIDKLNLFIGLGPMFEWIIVKFLFFMCQVALTQPSADLSEAGQLSECSYAKQEEKP